MRPERALFDDCILDAGSRQLLRSGEAVHLSPKAFDLLKLLIDAQPRAMSKADLFVRLWPKTVVVEANLSNLIAEIRAAIGDEPRKPHLVRTVHGFGYAFIGEVSSEPTWSVEAVPDWLSWLEFNQSKVPLAQGDHLIGRHAASVVPIDAPTVSRHHAVIRVREAEAVLEDLGSRNGTVVNGERLTEPHVLRNRDEIRFGSVTVTYGVSSLTSSTVSIETQSIPENADTSGRTARRDLGGETAVTRPRARRSS